MVTDNGVPSLSATQWFSVCVFPPRRPTLSSPMLSNGVFGMTISGDAGPDYGIYGSTNLTNWQLLQQDLSPSLPLQFSDAMAANPRFGYYRVLLGP
jgi:hypothetical protein